MDIFLYSDEIIIPFFSKTPYYLKSMNKLRKLEDVGYFERFLKVDMRRAIHLIVIKDVCEKQIYYKIKWI